MVGSHEKSSSNILASLPNSIRSPTSYFTYSSPPKPVHHGVRKRNLYRNNIQSLNRTMLETESSLDNTNHTNNNLSQVTCTTRTQIKYTFNKGYSNNNDSVEKEEPVQNGSVPTSSAKGSTATTGLMSSACSSAITSTTKASTTTTFSINTHCRSQGDINSRPPFITTVRRGKFLKSKFDLMVERSLFTFSSRPRPVNIVKHHCCSHTSTESKDVSLPPVAQKTSRSTPPRGAHDYFNVMWDPHVVRGSTASSNTKINEQNNQEDIKSTSNENNVESKVVKTRSTTTSVKTKPKYYNNTRSSSLLLTRSPVPSRFKGRTHTMIQTDQYLEELTNDNEIDRVHQSVQTEPTYDLSIYESNQSFVYVKSGIDTSTQILAGELVDFDEEVQPILESLIGKILEQSMFEIIEEEEIAALREERNRFLDQRRREEEELRDLKIEHERISAEKVKEQLKRHLEDDRFMGNNSLLSSNDIRFTAIRESESKRVTAGTSVYTTSYLLELLPSVISSLRQEGFLNDNIDEDVFSPYVPPHRTRFESFSSSCSSFSKKDNGEGQATDNLNNETPHVDSICEDKQHQTNQSTEVGDVEPAQVELGASFVEEVEELKEEVHESNQEDQDKEPIPCEDNRSLETQISEQMESYSSTSKDLEEFSPSVTPSQLESSSYDTMTPTTTASVATVIQQLSSDEKQE